MDIVHVVAQIDESMKSQTMRKSRLIKTRRGGDGHKIPSKTNKRTIRASRANRLNRRLKLQKLGKKKLKSFVKRLNEERNFVRLGKGRRKKRRNAQRKRQEERRRKNRKEKQSDSGKRRSND